MTPQLTLTTTGLSVFDVTIPPEVEKLKADALEMAATIKTVANAQEQQDAITAASFLKGLIKGMEATRESVKKPVLTAGRMIDDIAKIWSGTLEKELRRVEGLASDWQRIENKRLEGIRLEQERQAREAGAAAEAERRAYLAIIAKAETDAAREAAQKAADEAAEVNAEAARQRQQDALAVTVPKAQGAAVKVQKDYELLDIHALCQARPDLVSMEPKRGMILTAIAIPNASIPGIRVFETTKVQAKAVL